MEFVISDKVIAECNRTKIETSYSTDHQKRAVDHEFSRKLQTLEFYRNELLTHKNNLNQEMNLLSPFDDRIQQTRNSLEYPKQISIRCIEAREDRIGDDLCKDDVEEQLKREINGIEDTQKSLEDLLNKVKEQLREYRAIIYSLEQDLRCKESALAIDKQNANIKITDLCSPMVFNTSSKHSKKLLIEDESQWEHKSEQLMDKSKISLKNGRQLRFRAEEILKSKTRDLIDQHNRCNLAFQKRVSYYQHAKNILEQKLSKINEQIFRMKQNMKELESAIGEKEPYANISEFRLNNRIQALQPELLGDEVENRLLRELQQLRVTTNNLLTQYSLAQMTLLSLNKAKDHLEREINIKTNSVKIDEMQCLTLRSSVHYHSY